MPQKSSTVAKVPLAARVEPELRARVEALQEACSLIGHTANMSDVLRALVYLGLEVVEARIANNEPPLPTSSKGLGRGPSGMG